MATYAAAWRDQDWPVHAGKLELGPVGIRLETGRHRGRRVSVLRLLYRDVVRAEMAPFGNRLGSRPTVTLTAARGPLYIAPAGVGVAREVLELVQLAEAGSAAA